MEDFNEDSKVKEKEVYCRGPFSIEVEENQVRIIFGFGDIDWKDLRNYLTWENLRNIFRSNSKWKDLRNYLTWENLRNIDYDTFSAYLSLILYLAIGLLVVLFGLYWFFRDLLQGEISIMALPMIILFVAIIYPFYSMSSTITLDRLRGTISVRTPFGLRSVTANFFDRNEFRFWVVGTSRYGNRFSCGLRFVKANYVFLTGIDIDRSEEFENFIVEYMDRKRPLPRGTAFDPYRQKDYERRKVKIGRN